jgi:hypothetical protein
VTAARRAEIEAALAATTPGAWHPEGGGGVVAYRVAGSAGYAMRDEDHAFACAAHNAFVPELLAEVDARVATLTDAVYVIASVVPRCSHDGCGVPATWQWGRLRACDSHRAARDEAWAELDYAPALRRLLADTGTGEEVAPR